MDERSRKSQICSLFAGLLHCVWLGCSSSPGISILRGTSLRPVQLSCTLVLRSRFPLPSTQRCWSSGRGTCSSLGCWKRPWDVGSCSESRDEGFLPLMRISFHILPRNSGGCWQRGRGLPRPRGGLDPPLQRVQLPPFNPTPRAWALIAVSDPCARWTSARFVTQKKHRNLSKYGAVSCCRRGVP